MNLLSLCETRGDPANTINGRHMWLPMLSLRHVKQVVRSHIGGRLLKSLVQHRSDFKHDTKVK